MTHTLSDSAQLLAKDTLVLVLSYELCGLADSVKTALTNADPFNTGMVIYYVTLGYAMPLFIYRNMVEHIKRWFTDSTLENFQQTFPWLLLSGETWKGIITIMNAWVDPEAHYSPDFPSVTEVLASYWPNNGDDRVDNVMAGLSSMGAGSDLVSDMKAKLDSAREQKKAQISDAFKSMNLTPDMIDKAKCALGEDATEKEMRNFLVEIVLDQMLDGVPSRYVAPMDKLFLEQTKCLYPQPGPSDEMKEELSSFVLGNGSSSAHGSSKKEAIEAINKYKPHVQTNWVTNPVQVDPRYWYFSDGNRATDEFNPVKEFPQGFLTQEVISFMSEPPPDVLSAETDEEKEKAFESNSLAWNVIRYYWHVGRAVADMLGKTAIEIALGSIISFSIDQECSALPTKYHRITLSNIPDYTGMQSVFITLAPVLSLKSKSITPCIQSNCLLNTGLWKSYDDYIFSTTALGYKEAEAVFHLRVSDQEPSIWDTNVWEQAGDDDERVESLSMSHEELRAWFHRIFLMTILPADRDVNSMLREEKASNINIFLLTLSHCVNHLGMPAHFIASVLEDLLKKKTLMTKATLSNDSPALYLDSKDVSKKRYALSAFHTELANQTAILLQNSLLGFRLLDTSVLPTQKASWYELKLGGISPKYEQSWAYKYGSVSSAMSLGFMLQKTTVRGEYDITAAARNNKGMLGSQKKSSQLRRDLLLSGDEIGHVFSCMNWDLTKQTASFWMCEDVFENFSDYHFRLVRTDGWFCLPHGDAKLGDAKRIG